MDFAPKYKGALGRRLNEVAETFSTPPSSSELFTLGTILRVYDPEAAIYTQIPPQVERAMQNAPGHLWAYCKANDSRMYLLPFEAPADTIYTTYGNAATMVGLPVKIKYVGRDISNGRLVPYLRNGKPLVNMGIEGEVADIGGLI